jgi:hypothetical protein
MVDNCDAIACIFKKMAGAMSVTAFLIPALLDSLSVMLLVEALLELSLCEVRKRLFVSVNCAKMYFIVKSIGVFHSIRQRPRLDISRHRLLCSSSSPRDRFWESNRAISLRDGPLCLLDAHSNPAIASDCALSP